MRRPLVSTAVALALHACAVAPAWAMMKGAATGYNGSPVPYVVASSGVAVTNTGISTSPVNMASVPLPPLGPNDSIRVTALWDTAGTATDTKQTLVQIGASGCTPLAVCASGGSVMLSHNLNTSSLVSSQQMTIIRNAGATNSQVGINAAANSISDTSAHSTTAAINTAAGAYINIDSTTGTSTADSIILLGYTVEVIPGR